MTRLRHLARIAALASGVITAASAGDIRIIANASVTADTISRDDLQRIFLRTMVSLRDGTPVVPVLQSSGSAHETVLRELLGKSDASLVTYYRTLVFTGRGFIPKTLDSNEAVAAFVAKTKGAIGYVSADTKTPGVKTLEVK